MGWRGLGGEFGGSLLVGGLFVFSDLATKCAKNDVAK